MEIYLVYFIVSFIGYILGSIPSGLIIGLTIYKVDIRQHGSGNLGGTNAGRVLGKKAGVMVMVLDLLKVVLAFTLVKILYANNPAIDLLLNLTATAGILGHCYPLFAGFRGGKAVSGLGAFILMTNGYLFLIGISIFFLILKLTKIVSISSITVSVLMAFIAYIPFLFNIPAQIIPGMWNISYSIIYPINLTLISILLIYRHRENISRLIQGTERTIKWMK